MAETGTRDGSALGTSTIDLGRFATKAIALPINPIAAIAAKAGMSQAGGEDAPFMPAQPDVAAGPEDRLGSSGAAALEALSSSIEIRRLMGGASSRGAGSLTKLVAIGACSSGIRLANASPSKPTSLA